ncbi:hypothetical protein RRG08_064614 [Elysia crispata]|uniref:Uncharacterized protein n=1 Tax=Elysia crispata TaxID=231223 RepID=A0AAE1ECV1_9GAST|nr:hypothetical protein RRG08_064614 [Elysia crispata]
MSAARVRCTQTRKMRGALFSSLERPGAATTALPVSRGRGLCSDQQSKHAECPDRHRYSSHSGLRWRYDRAGSPAPLATVRSPLNFR